MRKLFLFLFIFSFIAVNAQLQRTLLGNNLGVTKKAQVIQNMKRKGKKVKIIESNLVQVEDITFGGEHWPYVYFRFYNDVLFHVYFQDTGFDTPRESLDYTWRNLRSSLKNKYSLYMIKDEEEEVRFGDNRTLISAEYSYFQGYKGVGITYYDIRLFKKVMQSNSDEL